jgi:hypothetical protein
LRVLDKKYSGPFYTIAFILSLAITVLTSDQFADFPWAGAVAQGVSVLLLLIQQFTPIGNSDGGGE